MKKVLWILLGAVIVLAALFFVFFGGEMFSNQLENDSVVVTVEPGDGTIAVASELSEKGVIKREKVFRLYTMISGNNAWVSGDFEITPGMGYKEICKLLFALFHGVQSQIAQVDGSGYGDVGQLQPQHAAQDPAALVLVELIGLLQTFRPHIILNVQHRQCLLTGIFDFYYTIGPGEIERGTPSIPLFLFGHNGPLHR